MSITINFPLAATESHALSDYLFHLRLLTIYRYASGFNDCHFRYLVLVSKG